MDFKEYFRQRNLRKTPNRGVHFEQKTTPDLLWCVALVVLDVTKRDRSLIFSDDDIRKSPIFNSLMQDYFAKPPQEKAEDEYNKVSSYQLDLLAYAGLLKQIDVKPKRYKIANLEALVHISINDFNASSFLTEYTEKFLIDNDLIGVMEKYRENPTQDNYQEAKQEYWRWAKQNTAVRTNNPQHSFRVFNKIFNVFCYKNRIPGESRSNVAEGPCPYAFLIYNRDNFRDSDMPTGLTRQEYQDQFLSEVNQDGVAVTLLRNAKDAILGKYQDSEITDPKYGYSPDRRLMIHHILPQHSHPDFAIAKENLIALTPDQHYSFAHDKGTRSINKSYQAVCLRKKLDNIITSIEAGENFYDYAKFVALVNTCYDWSLALDSDYDLIKTKIDKKISS